jgi:hypothetical protein
LAADLVLRTELSVIDREHTSCYGWDGVPAKVAALSAGRIGRARSEKRSQPSAEPVGSWSTHSMLDI